MNAKNCIISCIDFRIQETFYDWLKDTHNLGKSDIIEIAGSTRDIVKPLNEDDKEEILRNIDLSVKLHDPENIILIDHQDCGGYAQDNTISKNLSLEEDKKLHSLFLKQAETILQNLYPNKNVKKLYISLAGDITQV